MCPADETLQLFVNQNVGDVAIGEQAHCWFTDGGGRGAGGGGFLQSEIESQIATACNHALAILLQIAQLNLQCAPTGQPLLFRKFNHKRILSLAIRGRIQYWKSMGSSRQRLRKDYNETLFVLFLAKLVYIFVFPAADSKSKYVKTIRAIYRSLLQGWNVQKRLKPSEGTNIANIAINNIYSIQFPRWKVPSKVKVLCKQLEIETKIVLCQYVHTFFCSLSICRNHCSWIFVKVHVDHLYEQVTTPHTLRQM